MDASQNARSNIYYLCNSFSCVSNSIVRGSTADHGAIMAKPGLVLALVAGSGSGHKSKVSFSYQNTFHRASIEILRVQGKKNRLHYISPALNSYPWIMLVPSSNLQVDSKPQ